MCFDGSGGHAPPAARHLFPDSAGRSVSLFRFAFRLGQRGIAPLCARPLGGAGGADLSVYDGFLKGAVADGS